MKEQRFKYIGRINRLLAAKGWHFYKDNVDDSIVMICPIACCFNTVCIVISATANEVLVSVILPVKNESSTADALQRFIDVVNTKLTDGRFVYITLNDEIRFEYTLANCCSFMTLALEKAVAMCLDTVAHYGACFVRMCFGLTDPGIETDMIRDPDSVALLDFDALHPHLYYSKHRSECISSSVTAHDKTTILMPPLTRL